MSLVARLKSTVPRNTTRYLMLLVQAVGDSWSRWLARCKRDLELMDVVSPVSIMQSTPRRAANKSNSFRVRVLSTALLLWLYRVYKRLLHFIWGVSAIDRICRLGSLEDQRAMRPNAAPYHRLLVRRAVWLLDMEFILSQQLADERLTIEHYSATPEMLDGDDLAKTLMLSVCRLKRMDITKSPAKFLEKSIRQILLIERLKVEVMDHAREKVEWRESSSQLTESWDALHAHSYWPPAADAAAVSRRSRAGHNWVTLGFQGVDPSDDFRGTGKLGLHFFHHMCLSHTGRMARIIVQCRSPEIHLDTLKIPWYPAALVSIHITSLLARLLYTGELRLWIIFSMEANSTPDDLWDLLANLHSYMFMEFHRFWRHEVRRRAVLTIMDFEPCFASFTRKIEAVLQRRPVKWSGMDFIFKEFSALYRYFHRMDYVLANIPYDKREFEMYFDANEVQDAREVEHARNEKVLAEFGYEMEEFTSSDSLVGKAKTE